MGHVSRKLSSSIEGALAGGGDPATSPLYVFGPFLRLIVGAGVASVTFGASVWLVVVTILTVSAMYRLVMIWVVDGSGGSGLSEEEFGPWAVKVNAGITFVEYTLTFLVSIAALVTFIADRLPLLNESVLGVPYRALAAVLVSILTGWLVNRGPATSARAFGPATAGVLVLLWVMIFATVARRGLQLPTVDWRAFNAEHIGFTLGGYARILAVMTGIEIFANLVAAYRGEPKVKSRKAFGSLLMVMVTTALTMLIVGPAILALSDPIDAEVSVFTQTMDALLPGPIALAGTVVGVAVLLSAAAASALGLQNLFVGLKLRHYVPPTMGRLNRFGVAPGPVWLEVGIVVLSFLLFGTSEQTYLAIYAAGVFILLSMTGWASAKRLLRQMKERVDVKGVAVLGGVTLAALLTSSATVIIFWERFTEGAWTYFLFLPLLYLVFGYFRSRLGAATSTADSIGAVVASSNYMLAPEMISAVEDDRSVRHILVPHDGSDFAGKALPVAARIAAAWNAAVTLLHVGDGLPQPVHASTVNLTNEGIQAAAVLRDGKVAPTIAQVADELSADLIVMGTHGHTGLRRALLGSVANEVVRQSHRAMIVVPPHAEVDGWSPSTLLVPLDTSPASERALPFASSLASRLRTDLRLLSVPDFARSEEELAALLAYLESLAAAFEDRGITTQAVVSGMEPVAEILAQLAEDDGSMVMLTTHGRSGLDGVLIGSVAIRVIHHSDRPVFVVPAIEHRAGVRTELATQEVTPLC